jgi:4'-phosphopantetheinyl transferase EntD
VAGGLTDLSARDLVALQRAIDELCAPGVVGGVAAIDELADAPLIGVELELVDGASPARAAAVRAGRALVRRLAGTDLTLRRSANGAPEGPDGRPVSIAHDAEVVVAVVGPPDGAALGIDVERVDVDGSIHDDLRDVVFAPGDAPLDALAMFVVKEAAYKAWSRPGRPVIGFDAAMVRERGDHLVATISRPDDPTTVDVWVAVRRTDRHLVAVATVIG